MATASLELGIDIGDVDLVCQIGSPRSIASFLQRVGRSGHAVDGTPKGRLFPLSRDELVECAALLDSVRRGELDRAGDPATSRSTCWRSRSSPRSRRANGSEDALFALIRRAWPYRDLPRADFDAVVAHAGRGVQHAARPARRAASITTRSTACCAAGAARG